MPSTSDTSSFDPARADTSAPPRIAGAEAARVADFRLEQWYRARRLQLPPEVQAGFTAMAFEAIAREPGHDPDAVMDTLIGELDERLEQIAASEVGSRGLFGRRARPSLLQRLRRPFRAVGRTRRH